ncbi:MAG: Molybdopterin synthase sulfur carrier subunit, partial [uncultured Rubrobacteraceae bacterium]
GRSPLVRGGGRPGRHAQGSTERRGGRDPRGGLAAARREVSGARFHARHVGLRRQRRVRAHGRARGTGRRGGRATPRLRRL